MAKKNGNGEGGITRHKGSGLYMARYTVQTPHGTQAQDALRQDASGGGREAHQSQGDQGRRASI
jgi:hypothetical protein